MTYLSFSEYWDLNGGENKLFFLEPVQNDSTSSYSNVPKEVVDQSWQWFNRKKWTDQGEFVRIQPGLCQGQVGDGKRIPFVYGDSKRIFFLIHESNSNNFCHGHTTVVSTFI